MKTIRRTCNREGCTNGFDTDGRRWYCSRACSLAVWRNRKRPRSDIARPDPGTRRNRITSGYSDGELDDLTFIAADEGVTLGELQRRIVTDYIRSYDL